MGPWFGVIAGGTGDRPPPRSKMAATFNFKHEMARVKNKRNNLKPLQLNNIHCATRHRILE